jgi:hypothetical protein
VNAVVSDTAARDLRPHWAGILAAAAATVAAITLVGLEVHPAASAGLVALVIAATGFPAIALWASRVSNIELVQSSARSSRARNELIGIAITGLRDDIRAAADSQSRAVVEAIGSLQAVEESGSRAIVAEVHALGETISRSSADQVRALREAREAAERQERATQELAQLQARAEERARPQVYVQTQVRPFWLFFRHNWVVIANAAGPARGVVISYRFLQQNDWSRIPVAPFELGTQQQREFDIGDVNSTAGSNHIWLLVEYRDDANHRYAATVDLALGDGQWRLTVARQLD